MLYRDTITGTIWLDVELVEALREEIVELDDEQLLKAEYDMYGDLAIREYLIEASLVGLYSCFDGSEIVFRRIRDAKAFTADEIEVEFAQDVCDLDAEHRAEITFADWLGKVGFVESGEDD